MTRCPKCDSALTQCPCCGKPEYCPKCAACYGYEGVMKLPEVLVASTIKAPTEAGGGDN